LYRVYFEEGEFYNLFIIDNAMQYTLLLCYFRLKLCEAAQVALQPAPNPQQTKQALEQKSNRVERRLRPNLFAEVSEEQTPGSRSVGARVRQS